jgi:hypothetical protein
MAAKTAAEKNLTVAIIEKRRDITRWARPDCMMFLGLEVDSWGKTLKSNPDGFCSRIMVSRLNTADLSIP